VRKDGAVPTDAKDSGLHTTSMGERGPLLVFCHGLFGQGKNWTTVAKAFAATHRVLLVDMPHHGRSEWPEHFDYVDVADRVAALFAEDDPVALVGHSMGGKAAMVLALRHPALVERLCVVDVSPVTYRGRSEFAGYIEAMRALDLLALERRAEADAALVEAVPDPTVRSFLLQNLRRHDTGWSWQPNLAVLGRDLDALGGWPEEALAGTPPYEGRTLWIAGQRSAYVRDEYAPTMDRWFPRNRRVTIKDAGHWVHAEQPRVFVEVLRRFLDARP
jgi:pimeloyl-ACP methyl ester carboxylesterase